MFSLLLKELIFIFYYLRACCVFHISIQCTNVDSYIMGRLSFQVTSPALSFKAKQFVLHILCRICIMYKFLYVKFMTPIISSICTLFYYIIRNVNNRKSRKICPFFVQVIQVLLPIFTCLKQFPTELSFMQCHNEL